MKILNRRNDNAPALIFDNEIITWKYFKESIYKSADFINNNFNLSEDTLMLVFLNNSLDFVSIFYAIFNTKGIFFPIDINLKPIDIKKLIKKFNIKHVITEKKYLFIFSKLNLNILYINDFYQKNKSTNEKISEKKDLKTNVICQLTSGSTGDSKPVFRTYYDLLEECKNVSKRLKLNSRDTLYCPLKLSHSYALTTCLTSILYSGGCFTGLKKFIPSTFKNNFQKKITIFAASPYIYKLILKFKNINLNQIKLLISAGALLPEKIIKNFYCRFNKNISILYGMTESGAVSINYPFDTKNELSVGEPFSHIKINIQNDHTIDIIKKRLIIKTSDIGRWTKEGNLIIEGRNDNLIELIGKKINPLKIERELKKHPLIKDVKVNKEIIKDKEQLIARYIASQKINMNELFEYSLSKLPRYMVPTIFLKVNKFKEKSLI